MPNGDPEFHLKEVPKLEAFFEPIAEPLNGFSQRYNLKLQKYYHQSPSWNLMFRHPQGGLGKIEVCKDTDSTVFLVAHWWYDDYDKITRFWKFVKHDPSRKNVVAISSALEVSLRSILSWQFGQWDKQISGFDSWRNTWTKEQFEELANDYPVPNLD